MKIIGTIIGKAEKKTNNLCQARNMGLQTRDAIFVKRYLVRSILPELDTQFHEHENDTFVRFATFPETSLAITEDILQSLIDILDFTDLEKVDYATESSQGFETGFAPITAIVVRIERGWMKNLHGV